MDTFLESPQGDAAFRALMLSPPTAPRKAVRKRKAAVETAAPVAIVSLYDLWKASPRGKRKHVSPLGEKLPTYADWCRKCGLKGDAAKREVARAKAYWAIERARVSP